MEASFQYLDFQIPVFFDWPEGIRYKVVTKGRRTGITKGAALSFIEDLLDREGPLLWADTINANIDKYIQRYFLPELKNNRIQHQWEAQKKQLTINGHYCDFRSADNPENWEGFGYKKIFLNEAGIILKNKDLYVQTVLPMLLDYPDSKLIAAGVPKGKFLKDGTEHPFYSLSLRADELPERYQRIALTSYDNPVLSVEKIKELELEMSKISLNAVRQEIHGEFVDFDAVNPFLYAIDPEFHFDTGIQMDRSKVLHLSVDFNLIPFSCLAANIYRDISGYHVHFVGEVSIDKGSVPEMGERLRNLYRTNLFNMLLTGDALGNNRNITQRDNASNYEMLRRIMGLRSNQLILPPNPTHEVSRNECNYLFHLGCDPQTRIFVKINPDLCPNLAMEAQITQFDPVKMQIIKADRSKAAQRADFLDNLRYMINTFCKKEVELHQKQNFGKMRLH